MRRHTLGVVGQAGFTSDTKAGELADVMFCVAILAGSYDVDLGKAVAAKIEKIETHHRDDG